MGKLQLSKCLPLPPLCLKWCFTTYLKWYFVSSVFLTFSWKTAWVYKVTDLLIYKKQLEGTSLSRNMFWSPCMKNSAVSSSNMFVFIQKKVSSNNICVKAVPRQMRSSKKLKFRAHSCGVGTWAQGHSERIHSLLELGLLLMVVGRASVETRLWSQSFCLWAVCISYFGPSC